MSFAYGSNPLDTSLLPGASIEAELVFYPGLYPLRAVIKDRQASQPFPQDLKGLSIAVGLERYGIAIAQNPWLMTMPLLLEAVVPYSQDSVWLLVDSNGHRIRLGDQYASPWELMAESGGHPLKLFGEWDGQSFFPLGLWDGQTFRSC